MSNKQSFIPSFYKAGNLDSPSDVISYILNYYVQIPSKITDNYRDLEISLRKDIAISAGNLNRLRDLIIESLTTVISRYYNMYQILDITVDFIPVDPTKPNDDDTNIQISIYAIINNEEISLNMVRNLNNAR